MAEALDTRAALAAERDAEDFFPLNDLPNDVLVSVFAAIDDQTWVRHTFPLVCRAWNELYRSKDASPLHETLEVDFGKEVERAKQERRRRVARSLTAEAAAQELASYRPVVHASSVISWAQGRAGSVRKLRLEGRLGNLADFSSEDWGALVAVAGPFLTEIRVDIDERLQKHFWDSLRNSVVPAGRLRSLNVRIDFFLASNFSFASDVEPVLGQLAGSLEELALQSGSGGLRRFPESVCALTELRRLELHGHAHIAAIPAEISSLKKLQELVIDLSSLSSLPTELGELSGLTRLVFSKSNRLGRTPEEEAFPAELVRLRSLRELSLHCCGLRAVPAFIGGLESLESLDLSLNDALQIDAPLDFLLEGCPRLREVLLDKVMPRSWTPVSLARVKAFRAKLLAKNPRAKVSFGSVFN